MLTLSFKIPTQTPIERVYDYKRYINSTLLFLNSEIPKNKKVNIPPYEEINIDNNFIFNILTKDEISNLKKNLIKIKTQTDYFRLVKIIQYL